MKMNSVQLTRERLDVGAITDLVSHDSCGGISVFVGTTRDNFENKKVFSLEYEAYEPMAVKQMEDICLKIRERWSDVYNIAIHHRLGLVPVREASVVIAVASPHRQTALEGVSYAIEELKKRVPIWKKEKYEGDDSAWKENKESKNTERKKRKQFDFSTCNVEDFAPVPESLIQIAANEGEMQRRIECFVKKKRSEIDINNILDFTDTKALPNTYTDDIDNDMEPTIESCARTNSAIIKQEHSKCHLRVRRVANHSGPQTRPNYTQALDKLMANENAQNFDMKIKKEPTADNDNINVPIQQPMRSALQERFANIEQHLGMDLTTAQSKNVYARLKAIESRILHLESISPEYGNFLLEKTDSATSATNDENSLQHKIKTEEKLLTRKHKTYTIDDLDAIIEQMQSSDEANEE